MGHGITEIIQFIQYKKGAFHFKEMVYNTLAALVTLDTGFPVGGFTPAVYLGGSMGALMANWFKRKEELSRVFAASGATAAAASLFNAPLASIVFIYELTHKRFQATYSSLIIISAFVAALFSKKVLGSDPVLMVQGLTIPDIRFTDVLFFIAFGPWY
jgi:CIC family chloride channel protein